MRYFFMTCFILLASCATKQERAEIRAENAIKQAQWEEVYQNAFVKRGNIQLACLKSAAKFIKNKPEQCTKTRPVLVGSQNTGTFVYCFPPDMYGNQVCDSKTKSEPMFGTETYQTTCDANAEMRDEFIEACECKNRLHLQPEVDGLYVKASDLKYSKEYLEKKWREDGWSYATTGLVDEKNGRKQYPLTSNRTPDDPWIFDHKREQCDAKNDYFRKQSWYKRIPVVN
jgi:hypothetical protein